MTQAPTDNAAFVKAQVTVTMRIKEGTSGEDIRRLLREAAKDAITHGEFSMEIKEPSNA